MIVVLEVDEHLFLLELVGAGIHGLDLGKVFEKEVALGDILYAHAKLQKCAHLLPIKKQLDDGVAAFEGLEESRVERWQRERLTELDVGRGEIAMLHICRQLRRRHCHLCRLVWYTAN